MSLGGEKAYLRGDMTKDDKIMNAPEEVDRDNFLLSSHSNFLCQNLSERLLNKFVMCKGMATGCKHLVASWAP